MLAVCAVLGCTAGDSRTVHGALGRAADAVAAEDAEKLYLVIDQRARFAISSIVKARGRAAAMIRRDYPAEQQAAALAQLGDALDATDVELFRRRCTSACFAELAAKVGAPVEEKTIGKEVVVRTTRGGELHLFKGDDGRYGIVWNTQALARERQRAAAEEELVRNNAQTFAKRNALR
jgi:hypothetical protein